MTIKIVLLDMKLVITFLEVYRLGHSSQIHLKDSGQFLIKRYFTNLKLDILLVRKLKVTLLGEEIQIHNNFKVLEHDASATVFAYTLIIWVLLISMG